MAKENTNKRDTRRRPSRRRHGVPAALTATLIILALFFGGLTGFVVARRTSKSTRELEEARARITELEHTLAIIGYTEDQGENFVFDDTDGSEAINDLSGEAPDSGDDSVFWDDEAFQEIEGMLETPTEDLVVAKYKGGQVMASEVIEAYNERIAQLSFGFTDEELDRSEIMRQVLEEIVQDRICYAKAEEMGLTELTDADMAVVRERAQEEFDLLKETCLDYVDTAGMTPDEEDAALSAYIESNYGMTLEQTEQEYAAVYWRDKLQEALTAGVNVADEEVQQAYDTLVSDQEQRYQGDETEFEFSLAARETIAWIPAGYRYVKHIFLPFEDADTNQRVNELEERLVALDPLTDSESFESVRKELDDQYTALDQKAQTIINRLGEASFEALIEEYGQDGEMVQEPQLSDGILVSAATIRYSQEYVEGAMNLGEPGDVSVPLHDSKGVYIVKYVGEAPSGAIPIEKLRETLTEEVLGEKREQAYEEQITAWINEAEPKYYPDRLI
ncbi:MAG: hypothetical protein IJH78_08870 [Clostridia bacterium]|nr:hypothetical protein [Clostridia bacterium]